MSRKRRPSGRKPREKKEEKKIIYIFCEGEKTEPLYFNQLRIEKRISSANIVILGEGYNTQSLVDFAAKKLKNIAYDEAWIVMDKDDHQGYANSINSAQAKGFKVAYSNECFELWYLLHFFHYNELLGNRDFYYKKLLPKLKKIDSSIQISSYRKDGKAIKNIYQLLKPYQETALGYAKRLEEENDADKTKENHLCKPSTTVHLLVKRLLELK